MADFPRPVTVSCMGRGAGSPIRIQQWDGSKWSFVSDWMSPISEVVRPMVEKAAKAYAMENNITAQSC